MQQELGLAGVRSKRSMPCWAGQTMGVVCALLQCRARCSAGDSLPYSMCTAHGFTLDWLNVHRACSGEISHCGRTVLCMEEYLKPLYRN